jgi:hypothetical protein
MEKEKMNRQGAKSAKANRHDAQQLRCAIMLFFARLRAQLISWRLGALAVHSPRLRVGRALPQGARVYDARLPDATR